MDINKDTDRITLRAILYAFYPFYLSPPSYLILLYASCHWHSLYIGCALGIPTPVGLLGAIQMLRAIHRACSPPIISCLYSDISENLLLLLLRPPPPPPPSSSASISSASSASSASSFSPPAPPRRKPARHCDAVCVCSDMFDADGNGTISLAEFEAAGDARRLVPEASAKKPPPLERGQYRLHATDAERDARAAVESYSGWPLFLELYNGGGRTFRAGDEEEAAPASYAEEVEAASLPAHQRVGLPFWDSIVPARARIQALEHKGNPHMKPDALARAGDDDERKADPATVLSALHAKSLENRKKMNGYFENLPPLPPYKPFSWQKPTIRHDDVVEAAAEMMLALSETHPEILQESLVATKSPPSALQQQVGIGGGDGGGSGGEDSAAHYGKTAVTRFRVQHIESARKRPTSVKDLTAPKNLELARSLSQRESVRPFPIPLPD